MLPNVSLDKEPFQKIMDDARNMIVALYPEWTDFNYHDPGITILEMFSWLKEGQQYHIDRIGSDNLDKYLKFLGIARRTKQPARARVYVQADMSLKVLRGTRFLAGDIGFEAAEECNLPDSSIIGFISYDKHVPQLVDRNQMDFGGRMRVYPFGRACEQGEFFYIRMDKPLSGGIPYTVHIGIEDNYPVRRNPITDSHSFIPLAVLDTEYYTDGLWKKADILEDSTHALLQSGNIHFTIGENHERTTVEGCEGWFLRVHLRESAYDVPPVITEMAFHAVELIQRYTSSAITELPVSESGEYRVLTDLAVTGVSDVYYRADGVYYTIGNVIRTFDEEQGAAVYQLTVPQEADQVMIVTSSPAFANRSLIGVANGLPGQTVDIGTAALEYDSFELMTKLPEGTGFVRWKKVRDFSASSAQDRHYVLDTRTGTLRFGDCFHGSAPEGEMVCIACSQTYGYDGNVKSGKINSLNHVELPEVHIANREDAAGGLDEETLEECFLRAQKQMKNPVTAVTDKDYERTVRQTPGLMIEGCKAVRMTDKNTPGSGNEMALHLVVKPYSGLGSHEVSPAYEKNILQYLDSFRLIGTSIRIVSPKDVSIQVYADITVRPHYTDAMDRVKKAVSDFFGTYKDDFGAVIVYSELYGVIDMLDCVSFVGSLSIDAKGNGITRTPEGNIVLSPDGAAVLTDAEYMFSIEE